jgi:cytochrome c oxidase subunit 3
MEPHSSHENSHLAHQFDSLKQQYQASSIGMWLFLVTEVMFFGGLFLGYAVYRMLYPEAFLQGSHHLDIFLGTFNTVVLIGSSWTMALAVYSAQTGNRKHQILFLLSTMVLGLVFLGVKSVEYAHKFYGHHVPGIHFDAGEMPVQSELFFSFYFAMTGLHAFHMVIGMGLMIWLLIDAARGKYSAVYHTPVEMVGLYWHFVDLVWIFLFPLLYLMGRH